jgi:hypothetical protein
MRTHLLALLLPLAGFQCTPTGDLGPTDDTGSPDTGSHDTGMGPCEAGFCQLTVTGTDYGCHQPENPRAGLEVAGAGTGSLAVSHWMAQPGCCPTLAVWAIQDLRHGTIDVTYDVSADDCECECELDFFYTLSDAQPGGFTLQAGGDSASVTVE